MDDALNGFMSRSVVVGDVSVEDVGSGVNGEEIRHG